MVLFPATALFLIVNLFALPLQAAPHVLNKPYPSSETSLHTESLTGDHATSFHPQLLSRVAKEYGSPPPLTSTYPSYGCRDGRCNMPPPEAATSVGSGLYPSSTPGKPGFLRGVNIGGWLVLEQWMTPDVFNGTDAVDQWTFDQNPSALQRLRNHWESFFTEDDVIKLASYGINALRIPIGFWAYDSADTPYRPGADIFLHQAILWARGQGMKVWIDLHGAPGSQNGFENSGHAGGVEWQQPENLQRTISVLQAIATKYGKLKYADVVVGIELVNEPISWGANNFNTTKEWAEKAYHDVQAVLENKRIKIVMEDAFMGPTSWLDVNQRINGNRPLNAADFAIDAHLYQVFTPDDQPLTQAEHIAKACKWSADLVLAKKANLPVYVGEWSGATNICVNSNGIIRGGTSCSTSGCQCEASLPVDQWNDGLVQQVRRYVEAQLDIWEANSSGYFYWSYKGPSAWGFDAGIRKGFIPNPVTSRRYRGQCGPI